MKTIITFFIILISATSQGQNIIDIFSALPKEYSDDLSVEQKKTLIEEKKTTIDDRDYFLSLDEKNGYLRMEQSYNAGQSGYQIFEVCYWNFKNEKLIAFSSIGGSNGGFSQNDFKFLKYSEGELKVINYGVFFDYTSNIDVLINNFVNDIVIEGISQEKKDTIGLIGLRIHLPRKGKNISISIDDEYILETYSKVINKTSLTLNWNGDGTFNK